mgnify:FL=1
MKDHKKEKLKALKKADGKRKKENRKKRKSKKSKKVLGAVLGVGAAVILVGYAGVGFYYQDKFYPGTSINGVDCGGKDIAYVRELLKNSAETYSLTISERGGQTESIDGKTIQLSYKDDNEAQEVKKQQNSWLWPIQIFGEKDYTVNAESSYNEESLNQAVSALTCMQDANMAPAQDAKVEDNGTSYVIVPEVEGTTLDKEKTLAAVKEAVDQRQTELSLENAGCYVQPAVRQDDESLKKDAEQLNKFTSLQASLDFGTGTENVTRDQLKSWLKKGDDGKYYFDTETVKQTVIAWSEKYNTIGQPRDFVTSEGATVHLTQGDYGWRLWQDKTTESLVNMLNAGQSGPVEPTWLYSGEKHGGNDIDGTYVEISISEQRMWFYKNGTLLVDTPVVTGNPNKGNGTPSGGVWRLKDKASPSTLVGRNPDGSIEYETPVNYWMPFNGGVGIHDLTSRTSFGGDIYLYNGSHGCINTPLENARTIYENIEVNTPVVVY